MSKSTLESHFQSIVLTALLLASGFVVTQTWHMKIAQTQVMVQVAQLSEDLGDLKTTTRIAAADRYRGEQARVDFKLRDEMIERLSNHIERIESNVLIRLDKLDKQR